MLLSACRNIANDIFFYTLQYRDLQLQSPDIRIPGELLRSLGYDHHLIDCRRTPDKDFDDTYERSSSLSHREDWGRIAYGMIETYPSDRVCVKGTCSEICRYKHGVHQPISSAAEIVASVEGWNTLPFVVDQISEWYSKGNAIAASTGVHILDLFHWEHIDGSWQAQSQLEWDIVQEAYTPFNHRGLLEIMLGVSPELRCEPDCILYRKMYEVLWPEVMNQPINPPETANPIVEDVSSPERLGEGTEQGSMLIDMHRKLDELQSEVQEKERLADAQARELEHLRGMLSKSNDDLRQLAENYQTSLSWRITKPLRMVHEKLFGRESSAFRGYFRKRQKMKFCIKICASTWEDAKYWGDYHVALALRKYFGRHGYDTTIQIMPEWYNGNDADCNVVIHLRGLHRYAVSEKRLNIMWNFNHLDTISLDEYESYDLVFVASELHAPKLERLVKTKVVPLLLCTDAEIFYPHATEECTSDVLFVGNSRNVYRKIIKDLLPTSHDLKIWGTLWEQFIDKKYIQGDYFPNEDLGRLYSSCKILLNDHWDDMRELGFINMRIFDALASKAFVISDDVAGIDDVLPDAVVTYRDSGDLQAKVAYYLKNERARLDVAERGYDLVTKHHTFENRVATIISLAESLLREKGPGKRVRRGREKVIQKEGL
jgi:glycosyltransferase involved in cell wall biosynthesis